MPPPRKADLIPSDLKVWLKETLEERGFGDYLAVTEELNFKLEERGEELRLGKSAVHVFGKEHEAFIKYQAEASAWATNWMQENGLEDEAQRHNVLFQMITTLAFKVMAAKMDKEGAEISAQDLHFIGRLMKDVMSSSGMREKLLTDERKRIRTEEREQAQAAASEALEAVGTEAGLDAAMVKTMRNKFLGLST